MKHLRSKTLLVLRTYPFVIIWNDFFHRQLTVLFWLSFPTTFWFALLFASRQPTRSGNRSRNRNVHPLQKQLEHHHVRYHCHHYHHISSSWNHLIRDKLKKKSIEPRYYTFSIVFDCALGFVQFVTGELVWLEAWVDRLKHLKFG